MNWHGPDDKPASTRFFKETVKRKIQPEDDNTHHAGDYQQAPVQGRGPDPCEQEEGKPDGEPAGKIEVQVIVENAFPQN